MEASKGFSISRIKEAIDFAVTKLGYSGLRGLRSKQEEALLRFVEGNDVFVSLPTGYGKTLCFAALPYTFDHLLNKTSSIVWCVSPLVSLMMDQVSKYSIKGLATQFVGGSQGDTSVLGLVTEGAYQLVYISPEALIGSRHWQQVLQSPIYQRDLVALVVDEAHCVKTWGDSFRREFASIGDIRSIIPSSVKVMALTATATASTRLEIISRLCMDCPIIIYEPPTQMNIMYSVSCKTSISTVCEDVAKNLLKHGNKADKMIIYCRRHLEVACIYEHCQKVLGEAFTFPAGQPNVAKYRLLDMYTRCTSVSMKAKIVEGFVNPESTLRVVVATSAFGMGLDCSCVRHILHWGPSEDIESYVQQTGRAGRDGNSSWATLYFSPADKKHSTQAMYSYCKNGEVCRRKVLFTDFDDTTLAKLPSSLPSCFCCDICRKSCKCDKCIK